TCTQLTLVQDALAQLMKTKYPLEELLQSPLPAGVHPRYRLMEEQHHHAVTFFSQQAAVFKSKALLCSIARTRGG
uniref:Uncharacterized protein n=1 Tax=Monopterus albus TaxID=43700 RepID=A0A3Q3J281_MONAL